MAHWCILLADEERSSLTLVCLLASNDEGIGITERGFSDVNEPYCGKLRTSRWTKKETNEGEANKTNIP